MGSLGIRAAAPDDKIGKAGSNQTSDEPICHRTPAPAHEQRFDTLQFVETLQEAGVPEIQAKAISKAVRNAYDTAEPVTKTDLREAVSELRAEIRELDSRMDKLGLQLTIRLGGLVVIALVLQSLSPPT